MKKLLSIILLSIVAINVSFAQFRYGPTLGVNFSTLKFSQDLVTVKGKTGVAAGVQCEMMFPGIGFGLDFGLMYDLRGARINLGEKKVWQIDNYGNENVYFNNLTLPIDLRFKWTRMNGIEDYVAPFIFGGPVFSFDLFHSNVKAFKYQTATFGLQAGFGVEVLKDWQVQASYLWNLSNSVRTKLLDDYSGAARGWTIRVTRYF